MAYEARITHPQGAPATRLTLDKAQNADEAILLVSEYVTEYWDSFEPDRIVEVKDGNGNVVFTASISECDRKHRGQKGE